MTTRPIHIMVLAPLPVAELDAAATRLHRAERPFGAQPHPWTLRAGTGTYAALFTREPGTECSEWPLAEALSRRCDGPVYALWFDPGFPRMIYTWRAGQKVDERTGDPVAEAQGLGIAFKPGDLHLPIAPAAPTPTIATAAVVEGVDAAAIRARLSHDDDLTWLRIADVAGGALLSASDGDLRAAPWDLTDQLPDHDVYFVSVDRARREVCIQQLRGGATLATYVWPPGAPDADGVLRAIRGATTPSTILDALGVTPQVLPRDGWDE